MGQAHCVGGAVGAVGGAAAAWSLCGGADNDRGSCAAFGALYLVGPGMTIGAILRATRTSGWDGVWVGTASDVAMGVLVGSVAAIVSGGDQPTDYLLIGPAALGGLGVLAGAVVGLTSQYPEVTVGGDLVPRSLRIGVAWRL